MGRSNKTVFSDDGIERRDSGYYSTPDFVGEFISQKLIEINPNGNIALDPCVGKEELINSFLSNGIKVDSFDINRFKNEYQSNFKQINFFDFFIDLKNNLFFKPSLELNYDYYIANPPYNCHESDSLKINKDYYNKHFDEIGTYNTYSMFMYAMIEIAKDGALLGFITLDSFLTANFHKELRNYILKTCSIHYLILCPTDLFLSQEADVRTCIIILQKGKKYQNKINVLSRELNTNSFKVKLKNNNFSKINFDKLFLSNPIDNKEFLIECPKEISNLFYSHHRLNEKYNCVTGISTGNDKKYLSKYKDSSFSIPFFKNPGKRRFFMEPDAYMYSDFIKESIKVKNFIVRNKQFLFKEGISCSSMGVPFAACYLPKDSTYGVNANIFPEEKNDIWWLLSYLNSSLVTFIVRGVLIRSNMVTSGYVSRLPILSFSNKTKIRLSELGKKAYQEKVDSFNSDKFVSIIDEIVFEEGDIGIKTQNYIKEFKEELLKKV
jgi:hypothetical protein